MPVRVPLLLTEKGIEVVALLHCPSRHISQTFNFLVDTGSQLSLLAWQDAAKVGIDVEELPSFPKKIGGFGGAAEAKHFREPCFLYLTSDDGELVAVDLPDGILVWRPSRKRSERGSPNGTTTDFAVGRERPCAVARSRGAGTSPARSGAPAGRARRPGLRRRPPP